MRDFLIRVLGGYTDAEFEEEFRERLEAQDECDRAVNTVRELESAIAKLSKPKRKYVRKA